MYQINRIPRDKPKVTMNGTPKNTLMIMKQRAKNHTKGNKRENTKGQKDCTEGHKVHCTPRNTLKGAPKSRPKGTQMGTPTGKLKGKLKGTRCTAHQETH